MSSSKKWKVKGDGKMFDFKNLKTEIVTRPPRIVLYGTPGIGKSTWAAQCPDVVFLDIEDGLDAIKTPRVKVESFAQAMDALRALYSQDHGYKAVAIDSIDWLERLAQQQVCEDFGVKGIEAIGYGKGYVTAVEMIAKFLSALDDLRDHKGIAPILIGHAQIKRFDDPASDGYERYQLKLHQRCEALVKEWADCLFFVNYKVVVDKEQSGFRKVTKGKGGKPVLFTRERPEHIAKNRYGLPSELPFSWDAFIEAFNKKEEKKDE
jgi:hypothetical protein